MTDPWVAVLRSIQGNDVVRSLDWASEYEDPIAFHIVVCRESAIVKRPINSWVSESLNGLPDSANVAHWFDGACVEDAAMLASRFGQAQAMAAGLNEWEAIC